MVTENGTAVDEPTVEVAVVDEARIAYFQGYIAAMHEAITQGADVRGYFAWSFMDNFGEGYTSDVQHSLHTGWESGSAF